MDIGLILDPAATVASSTTQVFVASPDTDSDSDSLMDSEDNCPLIANPPVANGLDDDADCTVDEANEQANTDHAARDNGPDVVNTDVTIPKGTTWETPATTISTTTGC